MMGSRSIVGTAIAIGLLAGTAVGVTAQGEDAAIGQPVAPITFTASLRFGPDVGSTTFTEVDGRVEHRETVWAPTLTASDPRLEGEVRLASPQDQYAGPAGPESFVFGTSTWRIENEEGAWQGSHSGFSVIEDGVGWGGGATLVLAGEGAYEGLYAALDVSDTRDMRGVIFPAPPPPVPAAP